jgi:hypothetical protein
MLELPFLQELVAKRVHRVLLRVLRVRLGPVPQDIVAVLQGVYEDERLDELLAAAATCPDYESLRAGIAASGSSPAD